MKNMSFAIPMKRLAETPHLLAFRHPSPAYPIHVLILPRHPIGSLLELDDQDAGFLSDLLATVKQLILDLNLQDVGYRLITNGGKYQEVGMLHFHLVSGEPL